MKKDFPVKFIIAATTEIRLQCHPMTKQMGYIRNLSSLMLGIEVVDSLDVAGKSKVC